jgi:hypothetical protein
MANVKSEYGTNGQTITCSIASLASAAARQSTAVDNTGNKYLDALVMVAVKNHATTAPTGDKAVYVWAYGTVDDGTTYTDAATGTDGGVTLDSPRHVVLLGAIYFTAAAQTKKAGPWSVAKAFGGVLPAKWGIVIDNQTGAALDTTEGNHKKLYQGIYATVA